MSILNKPLPPLELEMKIIILAYIKQNYTTAN